MLKDINGWTTELMSQLSNNVVFIKGPHAVSKSAHTVHQQEHNREKYCLAKS